MLYHNTHAGLCAYVFSIMVSNATYKEVAAGLYYENSRVSWSLDHGDGNICVENDYVKMLAMSTLYIRCGLWNSQIAISSSYTAWWEYSDSGSISTVKLLYSYATAQRLISVQLALLLKSAIIIEHRSYHLAVSLPLLPLRQHATTCHGTAVRRIRGTYSTADNFMVLNGMTWHDMLVSFLYMGNDAHG